ncbi:hypothetical protein D7147_01945 [Micromonospora musae]|uniref:DNA-binding protein n=1 Tax=Micromonospora musae TaxID=1894970 RepID=A0A3A9YCJ3_9ACTN|nr:hypothetical protein [Micromonospora musae]RKN23820.1 hypothetical protein D7147_01945 [Micromonospora musae]RKN31864.1 hypothetical protein D7044_16485 [Micromonospora musae]
MRLVALSDIAEMLGGVSRTRTTEITNRASFPAPVDTVASGKVRVWDRAAVEAWIAEYRPYQARGTGSDEQP